MSKPGWSPSGAGFDDTSSEVRPSNTLDATAEETTPAEMDEDEDYVPLTTPEEHLDSIEMVLKASNAAGPASLRNIIGALRFATTETQVNFSKQLFGMLPEDFCTNKKAVRGIVQKLLVRHSIPIRASDA